MRYLWQRWRGITRRERLTFLQALFLLPLAGVLLRFGRYQSLVVRLEKMTPVINPRSGAVALLEARQTAVMVNAAARRGIYDATCLRRSLVLWWLLRRRGIVGTLRIGAHIEAGAFSAHAWVEFQDEVINDEPDVRERYVTML